MFNSEKKYSNSRVIGKKILNKTKHHTPPPLPLKLNGRSLINHLKEINCQLINKYLVPIIIFKNNTLWAFLKKKFSEPDIIKLFEYLIDNIFCSVFEVSFSTGSCYFYGYELYPFSR